MMEVKGIGVVGAGKMGNGIALSAAMAGYEVILQNRTAANLDKALINIAGQVDKFVEKGKMTAEEASATKGRIKGTTSYENYDKLDFVVEVVAEDQAIKHATLSKLEEICKPEAIIVSSTSTYSITELASATKRADRFAGMHFFIAPTKLVEITRGYYTSEETIAVAKEVAKKMGKVAVDVKKDSPGFIANRIYTPLFLEAFKVLEEGVASKEDIDLAMKCSYLPIGPFELADIIGLDVLESGLDYYKQELGPQWSIPASMKQMIRAGRLGKKTNKGWYDY